MWGRRFDSGDSTPSEIALQPIRQHLAFNQFKDLEICSAGFFQSINGCNVWMIQRSKQLCIALKPRNAVSHSSDPARPILPVLA
jgi:hypothetical protein